MVALGIFATGCRDDGASASGNAGADSAESDPSESGGSSGQGSSGDPQSTTDDDGSTGEPGETDEVVLLEPTARLVRISMAMRGTRPSADELAQIAEDPTALATIVDAYLDDPALGETIRELHNDAWLTASERGFPLMDPLMDSNSLAIGLSVSTGPLRLVEHVVMNDLPYTEIVTADYAVMDELTAAVWGTDHDPEGEPQQVTAQQPGPPAAGILSDGALWIRHRSDAANYQRGRANFVSSALLCNDFLERDIEVDASIDLADPDAVKEAVTTNESCVSCHQSLDGLASTMFGWRGALNNNQILAYPVANMWLPNNVDNWENSTEREPSYFGSDVADLGELGEMIAADPRFSLCAAKRFYSFFHQVPLAEVPLEAAGTLQSTLIDSGFDAKAMIRALVLDDAFAVSHASAPELADDVRGLKKVRPYQLARMVDDLTGFTWQTNIDNETTPPEKLVGDLDLIRGARFGFAVLAGGIDGLYVEQPTDTVNATTALVLRGLAQQAAAHVVTADFAKDDPSARRLLHEVGPDDADEATITIQLVALHARLFGELVDADDPSVIAAWSLFSATAEESNPEHAWIVTLTAMLQDHRVMFF
jgi:hypothetical protein